MRAVPASHGLPMTNGSTPSCSALNWRAFSAWVGKGASIRLTWDSSFLRFVVRWRVFPPIRSRQIPLKIRLHFTPSTHPTRRTGLRFTGSAAIRGLSRAGATRLATRFKSSSSLLETRPPLPWAVRPRRTRRTQHSVPGNLRVQRTFSPPSLCFSRERTPLYNSFSFCSPASIRFSQP